ncbi:acyl-CoA thioesterase [Chloroflexota bacterium]
MARIEIPMPEKFIFSTEIPIRIGDINRRNHLGHISFLVIIEEAWTQFIQRFGLDKASTEEVGYIMADLGIAYLGQGHYG